MALTVKRLPLEAHVVRRLLVNYRVDPAALEPELPFPLRPLLVGGWGVAGICLIDLAQVGRHAAAGELGVRSENAAHRIAVEWDGEAGPCSGIYVIRRDTDSVLNALAGGRFFPGVHHRAGFHVVERNGELHAHFASLEGDVTATLTVIPDQPFQPTTLFPTLEDASRFFAVGSPEYSVTRDPLRLDGVALCSDSWQLESVGIADLSSSFFEDPARFPPGTAYLDSAFLMRELPVQWRVLPSMRVHPRALQAVAVG